MEIATVVVGWIASFLLFALTFPLKAAIKSAEIALQAALVANNTAGKHAARAVKDRNESAGKAMQVANVATAVALKGTIATLKLLLATVRGVCALLNFLISLGLVGAIIVIVALIAGCIAAIVVVLSMQEELQQTGTLGGNGSDVSLTDSQREELYTKYIWVGDERTIYLATDLLGKTATQPNGGTQLQIIDDEVIAKSNEDMQWFMSDEMKETREKLFKVQGYNIIFNFGLSNLNGATMYCEALKYLPEDFISKNNVVFMGVNPISGDKNFTNSDIQSFNTALEAGIPDGAYYLSLYQMLYDRWQHGNAATFKDGAGLYYDKETNEYIKQGVETFVKQNCKKDTGGTTSINGGYADWMWVGDSRTVGMATYVMGKTYHSAISEVDVEAKEGEGLSWWKSNSKRSTVESMTEHNIVFNLGVNDLGDIDKYIEYYKGLPSDFYKNNVVIFMSINPVLESKSSLKNSDIDAFNNKLKAAIEPLGAYWADTNGNVFDRNDSSYASIFDKEGLHYDKATYQKIYDFVTGMVKG